MERGAVYACLVPTMEREEKAIDLSLKIRLPEVEHAEYQESACAADRNCKNIVSKDIDVVRRDLFDLPTLMLTLPARALPPSTARPVQQA